jgi:hypothetical protein
MRTGDTRIGCAFVRFGLIALLTLAAIAASGEASAQALVPDPDYWKQDSTRSGTVYRFVYHQSPQAIPSSYDPVAEAEGYLRESQRTLPETNPVSETLWRQIRGVTIRSALSSPLRALGTVGLAVGTFEVGWKIGSGINAKFLRIGIPEATDTVQRYRWSRIYWRTANSGSYYGAYYPEEDGWVLAAKETCCSYSEVDRWFAAPCSFSGFSPPAAFWVRGPIPSSGACSPNVLANVLYAWAPEDSLSARGPIEDYTSQPYSKANPAPTPPPQTTVEQSIGSELDKPENSQLRQWLNYKLGSPAESDPTGIGAPNPDIEFPDFFTHWQDHGDEFATPYEDALEYWRDAAEIVERGDAGEDGYLKCQRSDGADVYWDDSKRAIVIVKDGKIVTFFPPLPTETAFDYFLNECSS